METLPTSGHAAKALIARVKASLAQVEQMTYETALLVAELRDSGLWREVGYETWTECCETEFNVSRRHADRLAGYGHLLEALSEAAGLAAGPRGPASLAKALPEKASRDLGVQTSVLSDRVRDAVKGKPKDKRPEIVRGVVEGVRDEQKKVREDRAGAVPRTVRQKPEQLAFNLKAVPADALTDALIVRPNLAWSHVDTRQLRVLRNKLDGLLAERGEVQVPTKPAPASKPAKAARATRRSPTDAPDGPCPHPKASQKVMGWGVLCGVCQTKIR